MATGKPIPVRITTEEEFQTLRKRTKCYCVLGLSNKVNVRVLSTVINRKGSSVSNIRIFPLRKQPGKVLVRLNLHADSKADTVLSSNFWRDYIRCVLWEARRTPVNSRNTSHYVTQRMRQNYRRHKRWAQSDYDRYAHNQYDFQDVNPFESLHSDVD